MSKDNEGLLELVGDYGVHLHDGRADGGSGSSDLIFPGVLEP
jgi:hypothetical protein